MTKKISSNWVIALVLFLASLPLGYLAWRAYYTTTIVIDWSTTTELDTAGFNLYRSDNPDGPFEKVNRELIPPSADPLTGGVYTYQDEGLLAGQTYFYNLEEVELSGGSNTHGPTVVEAKRGGLMPLLAGLLLIATAVGILRTPEKASQPEP